MVLDFRLLGPAEVTADGRPVPLGGSRPLIVLAGLLLRANRVVPVDELGRWLWNDDRRRSKGALQTYVLRLRRALGDQVAIRTESGGYLLELEDDLLDLSRFRALAARGKVALDRGESRQAAAHFADALAQWRGPALLNVESDALHRDEAGQLAEERLRVRELWADALFEVGDYGTVVPELTRLTRENPLRERLHEQLMVALYRSGRQAEALDVHRRISGVLAEELGLDPGPSLQRTRQAILTGADDGEPARYRLGVEPQVPHQLPADLRTFSGRESDLKALHALLPEALEADTSTPIASVEGMGGIGKTTLAVHFAHEIADRFPGGQIHLNLRGYGPGEPVEPAAALEAVLTALGVPCEQIPADLDGRAASWRTHTAGRRLLVLLDNANRTEQVRPLLPGPGNLVVITSRWQLRALVATNGARRLALEELGEEDAVELLASTVGVERVARDPAATERFVRYCGGLPLAIRILAVRAAQFPDLPLDEFVDALESEHDLLGSFDLADGDGTNIRSVFSYSYQALEPSAARLLRLLGLSTGVDFTAPAAAAVAGLNLTRTRPVLTTLAAAHLLAQPRPGHYQFHDLIRAYAGEVAEQVDSAEERDAALDRLLGWYLASALGASRRMRPERYYRLLEPADLDGGLTFAEYHDALDWFDEEAGNLIAAVHLARRRRRNDVCWKLAWLLQSYFVTRSRLDDWRSVFGVALEAARDSGHRPGEAGILSGLGVIHGVVRQYDESRRYLEEVLAIQRDLGAREGEARAQYNLAMAAHNLDDYAWAYEHGMQALEIVRELGLGAFEASVLRALGDICTSMGDHEQALELADAALAVLGPDGKPVDTRFTQHTRGLALVGLGRLDEGIACIRDSVEMFFAMGEQYEAADVLAQLGTIHLRHGDAAPARECWVRSVRLLTDLGHPDADDVRAKLAALVGAPS